VVIVRLLLLLGLHLESWMEIADCLLADQAVAFAGSDFGVENPVQNIPLCHRGLPWLDLV